MIFKTAFKGQLSSTDSYLIVPKKITLFKGDKGSLPKRQSSVFKDWRRKILVSFSPT